MIVARPTSAARRRVAGGAKPAVAQRGAGAVAEEGEAAARCWAAGRAARACAGRCRRHRRASMIASRAARIGEGVARQSEREALDVLGEQGLRLLLRIGPAGAGIVDRGEDRDHPERQQAEAEDDPHLEPGREARPARGLQARRRSPGPCRHARGQPSFPSRSSISGGIVFLQRVVIDRAQRIADLAAGRAPADAAFAGFGLGRLAGVSASLADLSGPGLPCRPERSKFHTPHGQSRRSSRFRPASLLELTAQPPR